MMFHHRIRFKLAKLPAASVLAILLSAIPAAGWGDGLTIAPIEQPYVHSLEREIELHSVWQHRLDDQPHQIGTTLSAAVANRHNFLLELSASGIDLPESRPQATSLEIEAKWQLTEQGQYNADWGITLELEREVTLNRWEAGTTLLWQREFSDWIATVNGKLYYEWGSNYSNEIETSLGAQLRYRLSSILEPTLALHLSQDTGAIGPGLWLHQRLAPGRRLNWQLSLLQGFKTTTPEQTALIAVEYEFY